MTTETRLSLADINLNDESLFEQGLSHEAFRILRKEDPISWTPPTDQAKGHWNLVKYEDVLHVSRHPELFSSEKGIVQFEPINVEEALAAATGDDLVPFERLLAALRLPFDETPDVVQYAEPAPADVTARYQTFCGT